MPLAITGRPGPQFTVGQVFVAGGQPTITYNPRSELGLEEQVRDYIDEKHRILSVSGPTKSGKTVLLSSLLENALWLTGGRIASIDDFWDTIADRLGVFTEVTRSEEYQESGTSSAGGEVGGQLGGFGGKRNRSTSDTGSVGRGMSKGRGRSTALAAEEALSREKPVIIIDDFHYIDPAVQAQIVRGVKDLVFRGLPVILVSVPHRAYDAVRVEKEMTGRVQQLVIDFWAESELIGIARAGFEALNVMDDESLAHRLAAEAFNSPHLMQDFCLRLCKANGIRTTAPDPTELTAPEWRPFFTASASGTSKSAFDLLARGPRQRTDRIQRTLTDGTVTDIYGAVLKAIARTGPLTKLTYEEVRTSLRQVLASDAPQRQEVTRVLDEMSKIAKEKIEGEPVVDYDEELATLFISDPFFAYYLRWGIEDTGFSGAGEP